MCLNLKLKDNDKNKKWLAHAWQSNMWFVADEVRKYVIMHRFKRISPVISHTIFFRKEYD